MQHPLMTGIDGGGSLTAGQADAEWQQAWQVIAAACEDGLRHLHPMHPRRDDLLALTRDARACAQLRPALDLRIA